MTTYDTGGRTSLRSIPPVRNILGVINVYLVSRNSIPAYYLLRVLPGYGAAHILVHHRVQKITAYAPELTHFQLISVYYMR